MSLSILCQLLDLFVSFATASPKPMFISFNRLLWNVKDFLLSFLWHVSFFLLMSKTEIFGDNVTSSNRQIIVFILMVSHVTHFAVEEWWEYEKRLCIYVSIIFGLYPDWAFAIATVTRCVDCYFNFSFFLSFSCSFFAFKTHSGCFCWAFHFHCFIQSYNTQHSTQHKSIKIYPT